MKITRSVLLCYVFIIVSFKLGAQTVTPTCGNHIIEANDRANIPNYDSLVLAFNKQVKNYLSSNNLSSSNLVTTGPIYYIPVVVHVIKTQSMPYGSASNISYAQILSQINALNVAFAASQLNYQGQFSQNTQIQFCLARNTEPSSLTWSLDPSNNIEYGVMRYDAPSISDPAINVSLPVSGVTQPYVTLSNNASITSFNKHKFLNIWIVDNINSGATAGFYLSDDNFNINTNEGIVIDAEFFGENTLTGNSFNLFPNKQDGKTLVHEVGHYFSLHHTFYPNTGLSPVPTGNCRGTEAAGSAFDPCDLNGDGICDIAPMSASSTGCNLSFSSCFEFYIPACGSNDLPNDYMSYEDDPCRNTFTNDQKLRMWATLNIKWPNLWSTSNLIYTGLIGAGGCVSNSTLNSDISVSEPYACVGKPFNFTTLACISGNSAIDWSWVITGSSLPSYNTTNCNSANPPSVIYNTAGNYIVNLTVTDALGNSQTSSIPLLVVDCVVDPAKKSQSNWHFGDYVSLNFSTGLPIPNDDTFTPQTSITAPTALCTSISDNNGNDLYYGNAVDVWKVNSGVHSKINTGGPLPSFFLPHGPNNLGQNYNDSYSSSITIPAPGFPNRYYIFNTPNPGFIGGTGTILSTFQVGYALIDLTGSGLVINQGILPLPSCALGDKISAGITAIPHCNGKDYWLILCSQQSKKFYVYLVTENGITNKDFSSSEPNVYPSCSSSFNFLPTQSIFQLKASPLGNKIALSAVDLNLYDFNNADGTISNELITPHYYGASGYYGCSFSPNGQYVYATASGYAGGIVINDFVIKYDIANNNNTAILLPFHTSPSNMQMGPNNHIYFSNFGLNDFLSEIPNPDAVIGNIVAQFNVNLVTPLGNLGTPKRMQNINTMVNNIDAAIPPYTAADFTFMNIITGCPTYQFDINNCYKNYTVTWNFGDSSPNGTGSSITHVFNPGSYVVTATLSGPLVSTPIIIAHNITVTQTGASNANAGANQTICVNGAVSLSGTGNGTLQWLPSNSGLSCYTCPSPIASPLVTTTYTLEVSNSCGTQSSTVTVTVDPSCVNCIACNPIGTSGVINAHATNNVFCINNNVTITGTKLFIGSDFKIAAGVKIIVPSGAALRIINSHLFSCGDMWQGIEVQNGGQLTISNSLVEDAKVAVDVSGNTQASGNVFNLINSTFNRNDVSVFINGYSQTVLPYPFSITNCVFTCRDIPFGTQSFPSAATIGAVATNPGAPFTNSVINNATYSQTNSFAFLKAPAPANSKPSAAIRLKAVGVTQNPQSATPTYFEFVLGGASNTNIIDNQRIGVDLIGSNFTSYNTIYQNTATFSKGGTAGGIGINATAPNETFNNRLQVTSTNNNSAKGNKFVDCSRAINTFNYFEHIITLNDIRSSQVFGAATANSRGKYGVKSITNRYKAYNVSSNTIYNIENGVILDATFGLLNIGSITSSSSQYAGPINVDNNIISPQVGGSAITTNYVSNAIALSDIISSPYNIIPVSSSATSVIQTANNTITDVYRGIAYLNWEKATSKISSNTVKLVVDPTSTTPQQFGIGLSGAQANVNVSQVNSNNVTGFGITANNKVYAIADNISSGINVNCNTTTNTYHGIAFGGSCPNTKFNNNLMSNHKYGFALLNNGIIGQQGTSTSPQDNQWTGTWTGNFKTATINSTSQTSPLYIRTGGTSPFNPNGSTFTQLPYITGTDDYNLGGFFPSLFTTTSNPTYIGCPVVINNGGGNPPAFVINQLEQIALDVINYQANAQQTKTINKNQVYRLLKADPTLMANSSILQTFYANSQNTNRKVLADVETNLVTGDVITANNLNTAVSSTDGVEINYKSFYNLAIKQAEGTISTNDSLALATLAYGCPFTDGAMVYQARVMLNVMYDNYTVYPDNCPAQSNSRLAKTHQDENAIDNTFDAVIFPNPGANLFHVATFGLTDGDIEVTINDIAGKTIYEGKHSIANAITDFVFDAKGGIYFVKLYNIKSNQTIIKKLVVQK